jgi:predicted ABC-type ATPase
MIDALQRVLAGDAPVFVLIAGPNGAGKSTFRAKRLDKIGFPCVDPDEIAHELYGDHPSTSAQSLRATLEATRRVREALATGQSIALESVFSDAKGHKLGLLKEARDAGFRTVLIYIGVDDAQISIARVMGRVADGGHDVPDEIIEDRFPRCFENLKQGIALADLTILVDNSGCYGQPDGELGLRHYTFGIIEAGVPIYLEAQIPAWFERFKIADSLAG